MYFIDRMSKIWHSLTCDLAALQSIHALEQRNTCSAEDVEAVLLWQEPMRSSKYFLGGMYILICLRQLVLGQSFLLCVCARHGLLSCETDALSLTELYHQGTIPNGTCQTPCDLYRLGSYCQAPLTNQHVHAASTCS